MAVCISEAPAEPPSVLQGTLASAASPPPTPTSSLKCDSSADSALADSLPDTCAAVSYSLETRQPISCQMLGK